jgi:hypothetical protein
VTFDTAFSSLSRELTYKPLCRENFKTAGVTETDFGLKDLRDCFSVSAQTAVPLEAAGGPRPRSRLAASE